MTIKIDFWYPASNAPDELFAFTHWTKPMASYGYMPQDGVYAHITSASIGCINPALTIPDSREIWLSLKKGDTIIVTFQGERGFEGGPQAGEVRTFTVTSNGGLDTSYNFYGNKQSIGVGVKELPNSTHDYGNIKSIEFPSPPVPHVPSGLKPNTLYNY
jgi:hypothetical protein